MEEIIRIANSLEIPIDKIVKFPGYIEIIYDNQNMGSLLYYTINTIITYDTSDAVLNKFRWDYIYLKNQKEIDYKVYNLLNINKEDTLITLGTFRRLYVRNEMADVFCSVICSYDNIEWTVRRGESF